eukprot:2001750-Rhodomonas_salina.2
MKRSEEDQGSANKRIADLEETMNVMSRSFEQDIKRHQDRTQNLESERDLLIDELQKCRKRLQASTTKCTELHDSQQDLLKVWKTAGEEIEALKHNLEMEKDRNQRAEGRNAVLERDGVAKDAEVRSTMTIFFVPAV